jgi:peptidoglycan-associated lipoprotein
VVPYASHNLFTPVRCARFRGECLLTQTVVTTPSPTTTASARAQEDSLARAEADRQAAAERATREKEAAQRASLHASLTTPVLFQFDRAEITEEGMRLLDAKIEALQANPRVRIRIEGNADDSGSDEYNMVLSQRRAAIVNRYLTERGVDASRLQIVSFGEEKPACAVNREESCRSQNRRDEFVVTAGLESLASR